MHERRETADERRRQSREHRERVDVALVENGKNHVHHEYGEPHQDREIVHRVAEGERLALEAAAQRRRHHLRRRLRDEIGGVADRNARLQVEEDRDGRELIDVVHRLKPERGLPRHQLAQRDHILAIVGLDVEEREILGGAPLRVLDLQDDLVLVVGLLDEIDVILGIGVSQQYEDPRLGDAMHLGLLASDLDVEVWSIVEVVRREREKAGVLLELRKELAPGLVDLIGIHAGDRVGVLPLVLARGPRADLQNGKRPQEREHPGI